jgi:hypothetical protein
MKYAIGAMLMLCALGCDEKKEPAPTAPTASAVPVVSASATASAAQAAAPEASKAKLNGKSLSDVEMKDIEEALVKLGHKTGTGSSMAMGANQTINLKGTSKDKKPISVTVIRPTGKADEGGGIRVAAAKDQQASFAKKGATYLDEAANVLVAVEIDGDPEGSKKLLDALLEK